MSCRNDDPVRRRFIGDRDYGLRHRFAYYPSGQGRHGGEPHWEELQRQFFWRCNRWIREVDRYSRRYHGRSGPKGVAWVGDVGVTVCKPGYHGMGRGFDLTKISFRRAGMVDCNWSWRNRLYQRRRYLAVAASLRRHFGTVLTAWYNAAHRNHIHFDDGRPVTRILPRARSDTTLVQASCNILGGESLAIDGVWGPKTQAAYRRLKRRFNMGCYHPRRNAADAKLFLAQICKHGFANRAAGVYRASC